jgi:type IV fimbrial biogenesis protein FimT
MRASSRPDRTRGFTLIELVVTIAVAAILASLAAPSFRQFIASQRIKNASFDVVSALSLARSEAVTRNSSVYFGRSAGWADGWYVSVNSDGSSPLFTHEAFKNLSISDSAGLSQIIYGKDGRTATAATKITVAPATPLNGVSARCVSISLSGVPSSSLGACT